MKIIRLDPDKAYYADWLWLPKSKIAVESLLNVLELYDGSGTQLKLWCDAKHHIGVPRRLLKKEDIKCELVDLTPKAFDHIDFKSNVTLDFINPDKTTQVDAFADLKDADCGVLNLACGAGKTVLLLHAAASWGRPILIIANQEPILQQWKEAAERFLEFDGEFGWVQGKPEKWDWRHPITLAMIQSLSKHAESIPADMRRYHGTVIWDEIHHLSAKQLSKTADKFFGHRYGASATVHREDGTESLYFWHVGPIIHTNLEQDLIPTVSLIKSPVSIDLEDPAVRREVYDVSRELHIGKLRGYVGCLDQELDFVANHITDAVEAGRKILAVSPSKNQLRLLHDRFPESGLIIGEVKGEKRLSELKNSQLCFGITTLAKEALDDNRLDVLIFLLESTAVGLLQQTVGRIQRFIADKNHPRVLVIQHHLVPKLNNMSKKMKRYFESNGFKTEVIK